MIKLFFGLLTMLVGSQAFAVPTFADGCYQMYKPSTVYPVLCVSGSAEEGIGGSNARVGLIGPNSTEVAWCGSTESIKNSSDKLSVTYSFDAGTGIRKIILDGRYNDEWKSVIVGNVTIDEVAESEQIELEFFQIVGENLKRLDGWLNSEKCKQ